MGILRVSEGIALHGIGQPANGRRETHTYPSKQMTSVSPSKYSQDYSSVPDMELLCPWSIICKISTERDTWKDQTTREALATDVSMDITWVSSKTVTNYPNGWGPWQEGVLVSQNDQNYSR